jgi:hypothetical protein
MRGRYLLCCLTHDDILKPILLLPAKPQLSNSNYKNQDAFINSDFYCDEVLSGKTQIVKVMETDLVLAYHHTQTIL